MSELVVIACILAGGGLVAGGAMLGWWFARRVVADRNELESAWGQTVTELQQECARLRSKDATAGDLGL